MGRSLDGAVVVITGGSSGIGRCAALKFARSGSRVVLAGREQRALTETVAACRAKDGQAIAVRTDVRQESDVDACAQEAIDTFGQIDVWVNSGGVISYGRVRGRSQRGVSRGDRDQPDGPGAWQPRGDPPIP